MLKLVDTRTFQVRNELRSAGFAVGNIWCSAALSADERHAAAGSTDGSVHIWEVSPQPQSYCCALANAFEPWLQGACPLLFLDHWESWKQCWTTDVDAPLQTERGTVAKTLKAKGTQSILSCCWSPQGAPLVTSDRLGNVTFWEG